MPKEKRRERIKVRECWGEVAVSNDEKDDGRADPSKSPRTQSQPIFHEELEKVIDSLGHTVSEPVMKENDDTQNSESSIVEVSVKQVTFRGPNGTQERKRLAEDKMGHITFNEPNAIRYTQKMKCACHPSNSETSISQPGTGSGCQCLESSQNSETSDVGIPPIQKDVTSQTKGVTFAYPCCMEENPEGGICQHQHDQIKEDLSQCKGFPKQMLNYETINRYNCNHIQLHSAHPTDSGQRVTPKKIKSILNLKKQDEPSGAKKAITNITHWYSGNNQNKKEEKLKNVSSSSNGTLPQLYSAKVKNSVGIAPERFVFKAVPGIPDKKGSDDLNSCSSGRHLRVPYHDRLISENYPPTTSDINEKLPVNEQVNGYLVGYTPSHPPPERIDIYCFDHQNAGYFRTTDYPPPIRTEMLLETAEDFATKFWAEIFGAIHLFASFVTAFILQFLKFIFYSIVRPLMVGIIQIISDYFLKPLLTVIFNGVIQPVIIFLYNIATSFRDLCSPIAKGIGYFIREIAVLLGSIRLVEVKHSTQNGPFAHPEKFVV